MSAFQPIGYRSRFIVLNDAETTEVVQYSPDRTWLFLQNRSATNAVLIATDINVINDNQGIDMRGLEDFKITKWMDGPIVHAAWYARGFGAQTPLVIVEGWGSGTPTWGMGKDMAR